MVFIMSLFITGISNICGKNPEIMQQCFYYLIVKGDECNVIGIKGELHCRVAESATFGIGFHIAHCVHFNTS
jgi:hypothetical protein